MTRKPLFNMVVVSILAALTAESARSTAYRTAEEASLAFEAAWNDPKHIRFRMTPVALNAAFAAKSVPTRITKTELWAIEMAKAAAPQLYIPHVELSAFCLIKYQVPEEQFQGAGYTIRCKISNGQPVYN
ncbi:MAG: hypothetical protein ACK5O7_05285 [Holosporales bacterium]